LYTPDSFARQTTAVERAIDTGTPFALQLEMVRPDGTVRYVTSRGEAERDVDGRVVVVRGSVHDVTDHKQSEDALRESEASAQGPGNRTIPAAGISTSNATG
jgi:PAS domain S-box-containing protein